MLAAELPSIAGPTRTRTCQGQDISRNGPESPLENTRESPAFLGRFQIGTQGIDVDRQFTIFGASGAVTFSALSGVLLHTLLPARPATAEAISSTQTKDIA